MAIRGPRDLEADLDKIEQNVQEPQADLSQEGIQQAGGVASLFGRSAGRGVAKEIIEPLTKRGARISPESKVVEPAQEVAPEPPIAQDLPEDVVPVQPEQPPIKKPAPATEERVEQVMGAREEAMGGPRQVPSPSAKQLGEGIEAGPVNTRFYDSDSLAATAQAIAETSEPDFASQTVQSLFDRAILSGVPKKVADAMFRGIPMESKVGGNKLATQLAGLQALHDVSAQKLDDMMAQAASGMLTDLGKFELREALAQHQLIFDQLKGAKRDVARAMNVFKGARERNLPSLDIRAVLDGVGGDDQLRVLADAYLQQQNRAAKNKILETGLMRKGYDSIIYMAQATFLSNWETHMFNAAAGIGQLIADIPERAGAIPVGILRQRVAKVLGLEYNPDRFYKEDIYARVAAFYNGTLDGFALMSRNVKSGGAKDAPTMPMAPSNLENTPLYLFGKEVWRTPEYRGQPLYRGLNAMGNGYSVFMRGLAAGDGLFGGIAQRMELHEQAWRYGATIYDKKIADGASAEEALSATQEAINTFLVERPADIEASMEGFRKQITLMSDLDRQSQLGRTYWAAQRLMNFPLIKPIMLFNKSVTNLAIEGAARLPILNFISPRFYSEWQKGGRHKDLAISRIALGGMMGLGSFKLAFDGRVTGFGPTGTEDRNNLKRAGWQEFSLRFNNDEISDEILERLNVILGAGSATRGTGTFEGSTFVSFKRLEPVTIPFIMGAALADAMKYRAYNPDDTDYQIMMDAMMASLAEYSTNMPAMQSVNEFMRIFNQRQTDGGDKFAAMVEAYFKQVANVGIAGTPVVGFANSALFGKIERMLDPALSNTAVNQAQVEWADAYGVDATTPGIRVFFEAYNKTMSRVPNASNKLPPKLDERGRPIVYDKDYSWLPMSTTKGKPDEVAELLASINHGIGYPKFDISGVRLTAEQQNMYLKMQQDRHDGMTMDDAIIRTINERLNDAERMGIKPPLGSLQNDVDQVVAEYRARARDKMFGEMVKDSDTGIVHYTGRTKDGAPVLYPETAAEMAMNQENINLYGR